MTQRNHDILEQITDYLGLLDYTMLNIIVEGRRPICYESGENNHLKAFSKKLKQN